MAKNPIDLIDEKEFGGALCVQRAGEDCVIVSFKCGDREAANAFYSELAEKLELDGTATLELTVTEPPDGERLQ